MAERFETRRGFSELASSDMQMTFEISSIESFVNDMEVRNEKCGISTEKQ